MTHDDTDDLEPCQECNTLYSSDELNDDAVCHECAEEARIDALERRAMWAWRL